MVMIKLEMTFFVKSYVKVDDSSDDVGVKVDVLLKVKLLYHT